MQKVTVLCVGKLKEKFYAEAAAEYAKRLTRFCKLEILELSEERLPEKKGRPLRSAPSCLPPPSWWLFVWRVSSVPARTWLG